MDFNTVLDNILKDEGGYVNDPTDRGGETNYGITISVAREAGYTGSMSQMPESFARNLYMRKYIVDPGFAKVAELSDSIAAKLINQGVNMGPGTAIKFLQRGLNLFNDNQSKWGDIAEDGGIGPATLSTLQKYLQSRSANGATVMLKTLAGFQFMHYVTICQNDKSQEKFAYGWIANRV